MEEGPELEPVFSRGVLGVLKKIATFLNFPFGFLETNPQGGTVEVQ